MPKSICLVPAYGGWDYGPSANGLVGKNVTLAIALALSSLLQEAQVPVVCGRETDQTIGDARNAIQLVATEAAFASNANLDLTIRLCLGEKGALIVRSATSPGASLASTLLSDLSSYWHDPTTGLISDNSGFVSRVKGAAFELVLGNTQDPADAATLHDPAALVQTLAEALITWAGGTVRTPLPDIGQLPADVADAITRVEKLGILTRDTEGHFNPDTSISRWEMAVIVSRLLDAIGK